MKEFMEHGNLGINHVQVIVRAMHGVARCEGVHESEVALMRAFYDQCSTDTEALTDFDQLVSQEFDAGEAAEILDSEPLRIALLRSCLFTAFADGAYSPLERDYIREIASDLGVSQASMLDLEEQVRDHLLQQIARIRNVEALQEVMAELHADEAPEQKD